MKLIAKNVYQIPLMPRNGINCYLVDDILIDAGIRSSHHTISEKIRGLPINAHVLTHAHADHQGSTNSICQTFGIPLLTSKEEKANAESGKVTSEYPSPNHIISRYQQKKWAGPGHPVTQTLKEGDKIGSFRVIETPGHSKGHISLFRESDGLLIVGDVMVNMNLLTTQTGLHEPPGIFTSDTIQNRKSILKLFRLKPRILCFGHGPVLFDYGHFKKFFEKIKNN